jgi:hypothetical protein
MAHVRNRRQDERNLETTTFDNPLDTGYPAESASTLRRSRRTAAVSGNVIVGGSEAGPTERSPKMGSRGHSRAPSTSTTTPTSISTITTTNPIRRETPALSEYTESGRRNPVGGAERQEQDEMRSHSDSRRRRLYPPLQEQETAMLSSPNLSGGNVFDSTTVPFERPQSRAERRPRDTLPFDPPPEVVRLDSTGTGEHDNGFEIEIQNTGDDFGLVRICIVPIMGQYSQWNFLAATQSFVSIFHSEQTHGFQYVYAEFARVPRYAASRAVQIS